MQGAYLHVLVDMFGSVAVLAAGAVISLTGFTGADVVASLVIAALVLPLVLPTAAFHFFEGEVLARWVALFDARGPPLPR